MEKTLSVVLIVLALAIGLVLGIVLFPGEDIECPAEKVCEICPEPQECEVCEVVVCKDAAVQLLDTAVADFLEYLDDEDELVCADLEYDDDEVTVKKIYDDFSISYDSDDDEYAVTGKVKLNFEIDDEKDCRETFDFTVEYEEDDIADVLFNPVA